MPRSNFAAANWQCRLVALCLCAPALGFSQEEPILEIDPQGHSAIIKEVMFTPEGRTLVSVSDDKTIRLWDVENGDLLKTIRGQIRDGDEGKLYAGALSPDGRTLAVGGYTKDDEIRLINIETGEQIGLLKGHSNVIYALAFSRDGRLLASGSGDKTVRIWQIANARGSSVQTEALATLEGHTNDVYSVAFAPEGSKLVSASLDHTLRMWRADSRGRFSSSNSIEMKKHTAEVRCIAWSPDGRYIVSGGRDDKKILLWDGEGNFIKEIDTYSGNVVTVSFSSDSKKLVAGGTGNYEARVYAIPSGTIISRFTKHTNTVYSSAFYGNDLIATTGGDDNDIYIWEANTATVKTHLLGKGRTVWAVAFGDGLRVAFGQTNTPESLINLPLEKTFDFAAMQLNQQQPPASRFTRTKTTYLGRTLRTVNEYELELGNGATIKNDEKTDQRIRAYTFTNEGNVVVGSSFSLRLYTGDGTFVRKFVGHTGEVWAVSVSRDGRLLASASDDQTIKLWNLSTGELLATLFVASDNEWVCWTPKGYYAASAGGEKYIGWHLNHGMDKAAEFFPVYTFRRKFYNPELVMRTIELFSFDKALAEYNATARRPVEVAPVTKSLPPEVQWLAPVTFSTKVEAGSITIKAALTSAINITDMKILVAGRPVATKDKITVLPGATATSKTIQCSVPLQNGENRISIFAANSEASATSSERVVMYEDVSALKPTLYVVSIGISDYQQASLSLRYADDDARAISRLYATQHGRLFKAVQIKSLYDAGATQAAIIDALEWLDESATQKDVAVVFVAAHGYNERGNYYILPYDGDPQALRKTAVDWRDFADILGNLPARILLFLDTCHSGGFDPDLLLSFRGSPIDNTEAIRDLASEERGVVVMAASTGSELSQERSEWGHGAFTKAIIEGLESGKADYTADGIIYIRELDQYVSERVKALTNGEQHPTTQKPSTINRFPVFQLR